MVSKPSNLANLLAAGVLRRHQPGLVELETHLGLARDALHDAGLKETSASGRFTGLYNAGHQFALAAFKISGYRPGDGGGHRQHLFASLEHAVPATEQDKPVFEKAHRDRNNAEYHGMPVIYSGSETEAFAGAIKNLQEEVELMFRSWKKQHAPSTKR
jgi:hypothetical protein